MALSVRRAVALTLDDLVGLLYATPGVVPEGRS